MNPSAFTLQREATVLFDSFRGQLNDVRPELLRRFPFDEYVRLFELADAMHGYRHVSDDASRWCRALEREAGGPTLELYHKAVLALLLSTSGKRAERLRVPPSVLALVQTTLHRILSQLPLTIGTFYRHENDLFAKDFALSRFKLLPCGAELVDVHSGVPRRTLFLGGLSGIARAARFFYGKARGLAPWYESHWDRRLVRDFNRAAYDRCYVRTAELLELNPEIRGMMSSSWWFDPALERISPGLAFLRTIPEQHGARLFRVGVRPEATADALARAPERTALHASGAYRPTVYMLAWARDDMLRWARSQDVAPGRA